MPHVDEGTLHAWLDGALQAEDTHAAAAVERHIAMCADCRARLDDARGVRDEADAILAHVEPDEIDAPPFAEIVERARARGTGPEEAPDAESVGAGHDAAAPGESAASAHATAPRGGGSHRRRGRIPLAWAASVAIAIAGGWWARELAAPAGTGIVAQRTESAPTRSGESDARRPPSSSRDARAGAEEAASSGTTGAARERVDAARLAADEERAASPARPNDAAERTTAPAPTEVAAADRPRPAADAASASVEPTADADDDADRRIAALTGDSVVTASGRRTPGVTAPNAAAPDPEAGARSMDPDIAIDELVVTGVRAAAPADSPAVPRDASGADATAAAASRDAWRPATHAEAERWVRGPIFVLPDAPIIDFALGGTEAAPAVRTRQRLPDGTSLGLIQRPAPGGGPSLLRSRLDDADPALPLVEAPEAARAPAALARADAADAAADTSATPAPTLDLAGFRLRPQAPLPADSLRSLLRRLRPYDGSRRP